MSTATLDKGATARLLVHKIFNHFKDSVGGSRYEAVRTQLHRDFGDRFTEPELSKILDDAAKANTLYQTGNAAWQDVLPPLDDPKLDPAPQRPAESTARPPAGQRDDLRERLLAAAKRLKENEGEGYIGPDLVERVAQHIESLLPEDVLEVYNHELAAKSGRLSYQDIALIACIHRRSVMENEGGASPFHRFSEAAVKFKLREKPFDNRQSRYALTILTELGFTHEVAKAVYKKKGHPDNKAACWTLTDDQAWTELFETDI